MDILKEDELVSVIDGKYSKPSRRKKIANCANYIRMGATSLGSAGAVVGGFGGALGGGSLGSMAGSAVCIGYVISHR